MYVNRNKLKQLRAGVLKTLSVCLVAVGVSCHKQNLDVESFLPQDVNLSNAPTSLIQKLSDTEHSFRNEQQKTEHLLKLSRLYHANGYLNEAILCYEGLIQLDPKNPKWYHLLATILSGYGYTDDAIELWNESIDLNHQYLPSKIRKGDALLKSARTEEAYEVYSQILDDHPQNPHALIGLARLEIQQGDYENAKRLLELASENSNGKLGKDLLVSVYEKLGMDYEAFAIRSEALASGSYVDVHDPWMLDIIHDCHIPAQIMNTAGYLAFRGETDQAIRWLKKVIRIDPENANAHFQIAGAYRSQGNADLAAAYFQKTTELQPSFSDAWIQWATILEEKGKQGESEWVFYTGLKNCPNSPAFKIEYARRLMKERRYEKAISELETSIQLRPNEALAYIELARCHFALDQVEKGIEAMKDALNQEYGNTVAMTTLCFHAIVKGNQLEALEWLKKIRVHPRVKTETLAQLEKKYALTFGSD